MTDKGEDIDQAGIILKPEPSREDLIADYKGLLKEYLDMRPSGLRLKISNAIGKNKSFISQITNPVYPIPVPAKHLNSIFDICHLTTEERRRFLKRYIAAHPQYANRIEDPQGRLRSHCILEIEVPMLENTKEQQDIEERIRRYAKKEFKKANSGVIT